ncbi:hypothetical protein BH09PSE6_BH09PSE6_11890 [soil metagenome]
MQRPPAFSTVGHRLVYQEHGSATALRIVAVVFGIGSFAASSIFVGMIRGMDEPVFAAKIGSLIASLIAMAAFWAFGGYCLWLGLLVPKQRIVFDGAARRFEYLATAPARSGRPTLHDFDDVAETAVVEQRHADDKPTFAVTLTMAGGRCFVLGGWTERAAAQLQCDEIARMLQRRAA